MTRKVALVFGSILLLFLFTSTAMADSITFTFAIGTLPVPVTASANPAGTLSMAAVTDVVAKNSKGNPVLPLPDAIVTITSDTEDWYHDVSGKVDAMFEGSAVLEVSVTSAFCGGPCLSGDFNGGMYFGVNGDGGGWGGVYTLTYVSPKILAWFGDLGAPLNPHGSDAFTTTDNVVGPNLTTAQLGSGSITFQTVPEPGTLILVGTGFLGLAKTLRRK